QRNQRDRTGQLYHVSKPSKMARTMTSQTVCLGSQRQEVPYSFSEGLTREASHHFWMHGTLYKHVNHPADWKLRSGTAILLGVFGMQPI
ncbi:MAG: hypothetical protein WAW50_01160, partial [Trichococcus flocculiformis]